MGDFRHYKPHSSQFPIHERKAYDVFLSFRGPDVRETFVDHLYHSLSTAGLNVFIDSEKLKKGENIGMSLQQAIQNSTIYIPIFSPEYASSAWCLWEVSLMWKLKSTRTQKLLIPLFYNVNPSTVKHVLGPYSDAFDKHRRKGRHSPEEIQGWREALREVSCLSGWSLKETSSGYEGKLVKQVVNDILQSLDFGILDVARHPVGLKARAEEVIQLLKLRGNTSDRLTLGIWGMGGLGKTTLSKALYNKIHHHFEASSFVSNVKFEEPSQGLRKLQQQILKDLLKTHIKLNDIDHGKNLMRNRLASLKALVVLDDVDNVGHLDALIGDWLGEGSRIIITTRDKRVLELRQVDVIYPMRGLELAEGVELFSWHAFLRARPDRGYEDMTETIVKACSGLPLSLEIIGTNLYNRNHIIYWTEALDDLENVGNGSVFEILKISYDSLTPVEKHIFLDIACFFVNVKNSVFIQNRAFSMDFYARFWSALGWKHVLTSLKTLEEKALIVINEHRYNEAIDEDVDEEDDAGHYFCEFSMHEQIRDMGRRIVREESGIDPSKSSRVWQKDDIVTLMTASTIQENSCVEGLVWRRRMELKHIANLASLQKLKFLLWWKLQVKTEIKRLPTNLKYLVLSDCQLKDYKPQKSREVVGSEHNGSSVLSPVLPKSIAQLIYLQYLDMSGTKQTCLPEQICELHCLEELYLSKCSLEVLPEAFGNLIKLKTLDVSNNSMTEFPPSFGRLKSLVNLEMAWNIKLVVFPALPKSLIHLNARRCSNLLQIHVTYDMKNLKTVDLSHCKSLTTLPALLWWKSLRDLRIDGCKQLLPLDPLPKTLTSLCISGCSQLQKFLFNRNDGPPRPLPIRTCRMMRISVNDGPPPPRLPSPSLPRPPSPSLPRPPRPPSLPSLPRPFPAIPAMYSPPRLPSPSPPLPRPCDSKMKELCMIGWDNIRLNIYWLLKDLPDLEQLDLSVSPRKEFPGETQHLVGQKYLRVQRGNSCATVLFCFVLESKENVRLPQMEVAMAFLAEGGDRALYKTLRVPSRRKGDDGGKYIMRICVCKGEGTPVVRGGMIRCSYSVGQGFSHAESQVVLRQVKILLLEQS